MNQEDIEFLEENGWTVECESPLEIRENESGSFATGYAAKCVLESLRNEQSKPKKEFRINENVLKLMDEAFDRADYPEDQEYRIEPNKYFCGKFAELILKECIEIINHGINHTDYPNDKEKSMVELKSQKWCRDAIKEHFGVK